ncbi:MAG TPA: hypothetical protein VJC16_03660 [Candidatus Nanoarchaeia archaeon]|nr:hypothetical protein [Candidatus Nanoarchaeia archaeon]
MDQHKETMLKMGMLAVLILLAVNSYRMSSISAQVIAQPAASGQANVQRTLAAAAPASEIIPQGVPVIYGQELGVSYDDVSPDNPQQADRTIQILGDLDNAIELSGADKERYISILYEKENGISCEYCCGARAVIFENGQPACGCAHSYAMRGLAKYLITRHGAEYTDEEILSEVGKWKVLFFPGIHQTKAAVLQEKGVALNYINLASNKYRGIEQGKSSAGAMVGGC